MHTSVAIYDRGSTSEVVQRPFDAHAFGTAQRASRRLFHGGWRERAVHVHPL